MSGEKTEEPTAKKIRDARKKGQVANSKDTVSTALLIAIFSYIWLAWDGFLKNCKAMLLLPASYHEAEFLYAFDAVGSGILIKMTHILLPILGITMLTGIAANFLQVGPLMAFESLKPDLNKLNPVNGMKKIFAMKNVFELIKSILKVSFLGILVYMVTCWMIDPLFKIPPAKMNGVLDLLPVIMKRFATYVMLAYVIVASIDFFFQRHNHWKELRMSKDEVKREYKESEGDPHIKGKRKELHREMAMEEGVQNTKKSTVVVTNPTHYAVALDYKPEAKKHKLPVIVAKGVGVHAKRIMDAAQQGNVPVIQNIDLARNLFAQGKVNQYIPLDLIEPVAAVLRWVRQQTAGPAGV
jgi:type III secretion protein U